MECSWAVTFSSCFGTFPARPVFTIQLRNISIVGRPKVGDNPGAILLTRQERETAVRSNEQGSLSDKVFETIFVACLMIIVLISGAVLTAAGVFPGPQIARAFEGGKALYSKLTEYQDVYGSDLWDTAHSADKGVTVNHPLRAQNGVTLYTSGHEAAAYLVDMNGEVLHQWRRRFSTVWDKSAAVKRPRPDSHVYFRKAVVYPNGDLLAIYEGVGDTPYGYGLSQARPEF
jgi:hypothetical protein